MDTKAFFDFTFNLVTLNCLGVPFIQNTRTRLATIARELDRPSIDVICLQEVQLSRYVPLLRQSFSNFPFTAFEPFLYAPKGGLMTLTRQPLDHSYFSLYTRRGWWHSPSAADRLLHKGVLITELTCAGQSVIILNTHLTANYDGDWSRSNRYARLEQAQLHQLAAIINQLDRQSLIIIAGDFNFPRHSWLYDEFVEATSLFDPLNGHTKPTYYPIFRMPERYHQPIDQVFIRPPAGYKLAVTADLLFEEELPLTSGALGRVSDHAAIQLNLTLRPHEIYISELVDKVC
jgi:endonuclease/exonuclease/phosphatase family metal-dependent hydrolase